MLNLVVKGFATWRISHMLVKEYGPYEILFKLRKWSGVIYNACDEPVDWNDITPLHCVFCTSVWIAFIINILPKFIVNAFALSGIACLLELLDGKSDNEDDVTFG